MRRILALLLVGSLSFTLLAACAPSDETDGTTVSVQSRVQTTDREELDLETEAAVIDAEPAGSGAVFVGDSYVPDLENYWENYANSPLLLLSMTFSHTKHPDGSLETTIPGYVVTDEMLESLEANEDAFGRYESMKRGSDGSLTIVFSKDEHDRMLKNIKDGVHILFETIKEGFTSYRSLEHNEDMTDVRVLVDSGQWRDYDGFGSIGLTTLIMYYNMFNGGFEGMGDFELSFVDYRTGAAIELDSD